MIWQRLYWTTFVNPTFPNTIEQLNNRKSHSPISGVHLYLEKTTINDKLSTLVASEPCRAPPDVYAIQDRNSDSIDSSWKYQDVENQKSGRYLRNGSRAIP